MRMMDMWKRFYEEEDGMGTVEIVMIIAALMCIALMFRKQVVEFAKGIMDTVFGTVVDAPSADAP